MKSALDYKTQRGLLAYLSRQLEAFEAEHSDKPNVEFFWIFGDTQLSVGYNVYPYDKEAVTKPVLEVSHMQAGIRFADLVTAKRDK